MHRILLTKRGQVVLVDHTDKSMDEAISVQHALGGPRNRCREILTQFHDRNGYVSQWDLRDELSQWMALHWQRVRRNCDATEIVQTGPRTKPSKRVTWDTLANGNPASRAREATESDAQKELSYCAYVNNYDVEWNVSIGKPARIRVAVVKAVNKSGTWQYTHGTSNRPVISTELLVPLNWSYLKQKRVDGHLVIEIKALKEFKKDKVVAMDVRALRIIDTKRGPVPVIQDATAYKAGRAWKVAWHPFRGKEITFPEHVEFLK